MKRPEIPGATTSECNAMHGLPSLSPAALVSSEASSLLEALGALGVFGALGALRALRSPPPCLHCMGVLGCLLAACNGWFCVL